MNLAASDVQPRDLGWFYYYVWYFRGAVRGKARRRERGKSSCREYIRAWGGWGTGRRITAVVYGLDWGGGDLDPYEYYFNGSLIAARVVGGLGLRKLKV